MSLCSYCSNYRRDLNLGKINPNNLRLIDLLTASKEQIAELEQEIQNDIDFKTSAEAYTMYTLESGTFTYINKKAIDGSERARYLCANCYEERIISILQPKGIFGAYFQSFCPFCKNEYIMNKRSKKEPDTVIKIAANHYD